MVPPLAPADNCSIPSDGPDGPNLLVLSDLHLGEELRPHSVGYLRYIARLDRELEDFLEHYREHRMDDRPWRLIFAGDMVDFMSICLHPDKDEPAAEDERRFGLGTGPAQTRRKLVEVMQRHAGVFRKLAEFVAAGHELCIVLGNHDVDFFWEEVQQEFKVGLGQRLEVPMDLGDRISFHPWFYYEPELVYVEHGHQYDKYCSFDYVLHPVGSDSQPGILLSVAAAGMRYFCNLVPELDPHKPEMWGLKDYFRFALSRGVRGLAFVLRCYALLMWRLVSLWRDLRQHRMDSRRRQEHRSKLEALGRHYRLDPETLDALEALKSPTVTRDLGSLLRMLFVDRLGLGLLWFIGITLCAVAFPVAWALGGALLLTLGAAQINRVLGRWRRADATPKMASVTRKILSLFRVPFVVFGHSHDPVVESLGEGAWYFNTGSWVGEGGPSEVFTHLRIRRAKETPTAELVQWRPGGAVAYRRG